MGKRMTPNTPTEVVVNSEPHAPTTLADMRHFTPRRQGSLRNVLKKSLSQRRRLLLRDEKEAERRGSMTTTTTAAPLSQSASFRHSAVAIPLQVALERRFGTPEIVLPTTTTPLQQEKQQRTPRSMPNLFVDCYSDDNSRASTNTNTTASSNDAPTRQRDEWKDTYRGERREDILSLRAKQRGFIC